MNIESVTIATLSPDPANARRHPARNLEAITSSLRRFGQQKPIVVDRNGIVRAGNGTLQAARALGWTHLNIVRSELIGSEATAYGIADNRAGELAEWDKDVLADLLANPDIGEVGFDENATDEDDAEVETDGDVPPDKFELLIECANEDQQKSLHDELSGRGLQCRVLTL